MSPVNKKEPINGFPCHLEVSCSYIGTIYNFTLISSFIIWVRGYHQKTHYEAGTYLYLSQSSWPIVLGHDWKHVSCVNNKINEQSAFKITSIWDAKYLSASIWTHQTEFSIGSKGARDDAIHLVKRLVTSISQTWRMIALDDEQVEKSDRFQSQVKYSNAFEV